MPTKTFESNLTAYRLGFETHVLVEEQTGSGVRLFALRKPGFDALEGTTLLFLGKHPQTILTGDQAPCHNGCISEVGYGLEWFSRQRSDVDYLCGKFLRKVWVADAAREWMRSELETQKHDADDEGTDDEDRRRAARWATALKEALATVEDGDLDDVTRSAEAFGEWCQETFDDDTPENIGHDYEPRDAALLVAIQETFARLYACIAGKQGASA